MDRDRQEWNFVSWQFGIVLLFINFFFVEFRIMLISCEMARSIIRTVAPFFQVS